MAHISSNCLYLDKHDSGHQNNRTYEVIEVDRETRTKDCKIVIYSLGLICILIIFAMMFLNIIKFTDIKNNLWSTIVEYTCYFILFILAILFIYAIAKVDFRVKNKLSNEFHENNYDLEQPCSFNGAASSY